MSTLVSDVRFALRQLRRRHLGTTVVAVLALGVGIGGAAALFGVADATLLRALPYPEPERLVRVWETTREGGDFPSAEPTFLDLQARARSFTALAAIRDAHPSLTGDGEPERLDAAEVSPSLFPMLGARASLGRTFLDAESRPGAQTRVAVLSDELWRRRFGGDAAIVGRAITLDGAPHTVVGVLPRTFAFLPGVDVWLPLAADPAAERDDRWLAIVGRMRPGVTVAQARDDLARVASQLGADHPRSNAGWSVRVATFGEWLRGGTYRRAVVVLAGAVGCLLLLACANVANLLVAQGVARESEVNVRTALGASRGRIVRQLLTESVLLALLGAALGAVLARLALDVLRRAAPRGMPPLDDVAIDGRVLAFALLVAVLTAALFGLVPALRTARARLGGLQSSRARSGDSRSRRRVGDALVVAQVSLAVVLLAGAGLLLTSFRRLAAVDTGMTADEVVAAPVPLPEGGYPPERRREFARALVERVSALPGVRSAALTITNPYREFGYANDVTPAESAATAPRSGLLVAGWRSVTPDFFRTLGVPLLRGRGFGDTDRSESEAVVIVSASLARRLWPGQDAVGRALFWGGTDGTPKRVVGVVGDVRDRQLDADPQPMLYLPYAQVEMASTTLLVRAGADAPSLARAIRGAVWSIDAALPVPEVTPLARNRDALMAGPRLRALLVAGFATVALLLAALGVYGVLAHAVAQRTREIGVRLALGARPATVARAVVGRGAALAAAGVVSGLAFSLAAGRAASSLLYATSPADPTTLAAVVAVVALTALVATWLPSRRATRVDPVRALRAE